MILFFKYVFDVIFKHPSEFAYNVYDKLCHCFFSYKNKFEGWGIHLYTGKFGQGKTMSMVVRAYKLCQKFPQLSIVTNLTLVNFPEDVKIIKLTHVEDILNAPEDCLVLIDEIGTLFNSRDFTGGNKKIIPKSLFQVFSQCRKKRLMIFGTVQRFNLLDKQIRDITATVSSCSVASAHPFSRRVTVRCYDIEEYELYCENRTYKPRLGDISTYIQTNEYRQLYSTQEMVKGMLEMEYITDKEILENRASPVAGVSDKETSKRLRRRTKA